MTESIHLYKLNTTWSELEKGYMSRVPYASVIGRLMYTMVCTKPDLTQVVNVVNRYIGKVGKEH